MGVEGRRHSPWGKEVVPYGGPVCRRTPDTFLICTSLENGDFKVAEAADYDMGNVCKRHGSVLVLKESEYQRLYEQWGKNAEPDIGNLLIQKQKKQRCRTCLASF